jgi:hypothetical protein
MKIIYLINLNYIQKKTINSKIIPDNNVIVLIENI